MQRLRNTARRNSRLGEEFPYRERRALRWWRCAVAVREENGIIWNGGGNDERRSGEDHRWRRDADG